MTLSLESKSHQIRDWHYILIIHLYHLNNQIKIAKEIQDLYKNQKSFYYRISSNKHPRCLFNFKALGYRVLLQVSLKRRGCIFLNKKNQMKFQNLLIVTFQTTIKNNHQDLQYYTFQNYYLFSSIQCLYTCSLFILIWVQLDNSQITDKLHILW